jgi:hypothetical protein
MPAQGPNCLIRMPEMAGLIGILGAPVARVGDGRVPQQLSSDARRFGDGVR